MMCGWYTLDFLNQIPDLLDDFKKSKRLFERTPGISAFCWMIHKKYSALIL